MMAQSYPIPLRQAISPFAKRLSAKLGVPIEKIVGSGPLGRIVAADIVACDQQPKPVITPKEQNSALGTTVRLAPLRTLLKNLTDAGILFELEDIVVRAASAALDGAAAKGDIPVSAVALETRSGQIVFRDIRKLSLLPQLAQKSDARKSARDDHKIAAALSLKLLDQPDIRPVIMPLLPGRTMRLSLAIGPDASDCLLTFDSVAVSEDVAAAILGLFKKYLEVPLTVLA